MDILREKELYSQIEGLRGQLEGEYHRVNSLRGVVDGLAADVDELMNYVMTVVETLSIYTDLRQLELEGRELLEKIDE